MALYETVYYGTSFYGPTSTDVPVNLRYYRTNVETITTPPVYVFYWTFQTAFITPMLSSYDFELQLDTDPTFTSINLQTYTSTTALNYQNGCVWKGYEIQVADRVDKVEQTWYARVRTTLGLNASDWSRVLIWTIPQRYELEETENLILTLPDAHVYGKDDLKKPLNDRNTNLYMFMKTYARELDQEKLEVFLTQTNNYISFCRDEALFDNFGQYFDFRKPQFQEWIEYREVLRAMVCASLIGSTDEAIQKVIRSFVGAEADLLLVRALNDFFLNLISESFVEVPNGVLTTFTTTQKFVALSPRVLKNGVVLTYGVDYTEGADEQSIIFTVAPLLGDVLLIFYQIGSSSDPIPLVFDPQDSTPLTGTLTFTNGSTVVSGVGTLFTTELTVGAGVGDASGLYFGIVDSITDAFNLVLQDPWLGPTTTGVGKKLAYTDVQIPPMILWDRATLAHGVIIRPHNPAGCSSSTLGRDVIEFLVEQLVPTHIKVFWDWTLA